VRASSDSERKSIKYLRYLYLRAFPRAIRYATRISKTLNEKFILDFPVFLRFGAIIAHLLHFVITAHQDATIVISVDEETAGYTVGVTFRNKDRKSTQ